jgi:hypothetical protein
MVSDGIHQRTNYVVDSGRYAERGKGASEGHFERRSIETSHRVNTLRHMDAGILACVCPMRRKDRVSKMGGANHEL